MTEWFFSLSRDLCVASMINRSTEEMDGRQAYLAVKIFQTAEQDLNDDPDKTLWESYCGKYEQRLSLCLRAGGGNAAPSALCADSLSGN